VRQCRLCDEERRAHIDGEEPVPGLGIHLGDAGMAALGVGPYGAHANAGIIDDALEPPEMRNRRRDRPGACVRLRQLRLDRQEPLAAERGREACERLRAAVDRGDGVPVLEQRRRHDASETAGRAGDQDDP